MAKDPVIRSKPMIYRAVILGSGIFVNRLVNLHIRMGMPSAQTAAILKGAVKVRILSFYEQNRFRKYATVGT